MPRMILQEIPPNGVEGFHVLLSVESSSGLGHIRGATRIRFA